MSETKKSYVFVVFITAPPAEMAQYCEKHVM